jgi:hypothetical protein
VAGAVRQLLHRGNEIIPFLARLTVVLPIGPGVLTPMVKVLQIALFERLDLTLNEVVEFRQLRANLRG